MSRYIDADNMKSIKNIQSANFNSIESIREWIDSQPTADVRENVRGEWLHDEVTMNGNTVYTPNAKCSICDCYVFKESDFCPNCGADMRPISALSENVDIDSNLKRGES